MQCVEAGRVKARVPKSETRIMQPYPSIKHCVEAYRMEQSAGYRTFGTNNAIPSYICVEHIHFFTPSLRPN